MIVSIRKEQNVLCFVRKVGCCFKSKKLNKFSNRYFRLICHFDGGEITRKTPQRLATI